MTSSTPKPFRIPAEPSIESLTVVIDTREQLPFSFAASGLKTETATLQHGDYSIKFLEQHVSAERKSLPDLIACCGAERERFVRELQALRGYRHRLLIVEASWGAIELGQWRSKVTPKTVINSLLSWSSNYEIPLLLGDCRPRCEDLLARWLFLTSRSIWRMSRGLIGGTLGVEEAEGGAE